MSDDPITGQVCDLTHSLLMSSGAGCGKTYRMVERYTHLVRTGVLVSRIVAVTVTEKAAAELKDRVRQECRRLETEDAPRAKRWQEAARSLEMAPIGTIHSFCARLLRENALAAGVDSRFTQLDERDQRTLLRDVSRESLLGRLRAGEESARLIIARWGLDDALSKIGGAVGMREERRELLTAPPSPDGFVARWREFAAEAPPKLLAALTADERWLEIVATMKSIDPGDPSDKAAAKHFAFLDALPGVEDESRTVDERLASLEECVTQAGAGVGSKKNWSGREDDLERLKGALKLLTAFRNHAYEQIERISVVEGEPEAELASALCIEASLAAEAYASAKRGRSGMDFEDLQILSRDLLRDNHTIRDRVGERYDHVLVDEFQDTNALQKEIVWYVAGGDVNDSTAPKVGKLFVVGDAKQSIYAFRSADVSVFNATRRDFADADTCDVLGLEQSRRSTPGLVAFHNDLFGNPAVMGEGRADYEASYEEISAWRGDFPKDHDVEVILVEQDGGVGEGRTAEASALAERIAHMVEDGEQIVAEDRVSGEQTPRPVRYGDIAILMRAMPNVALYEAALRHRGIPYYTLAGRGFYNRQEIRDCLSILSVLENASDNLALASVLRCSAFAISDDTLVWLRRDGGTLWEALGVTHRPQVGPDQLQRLARAHEILSALRADKNRLSLSELVERMLDVTGLAAALLTQFGGQQVAANLIKLTDMARDFEAGGSFSLREFIDYLGSLVTEEEREGQASIHAEAGDVVQIMTIHKAKGMQWPVVIVPDLNRGAGGGGPSPLPWTAATGPVPRIEDQVGGKKPGAVAHLLKLAGEQREEAELRRLLYVALTRAEDHLVLSSSCNLDDDGRLKAPGKWLAWVTKALALDPLPGDGTELTGIGWRGVLSRPEPTEAAWSGPRAVARTDLSVIADALAGTASSSDAATDELRSRIEPVVASSAGILQAHVTSLSRYLSCPHSYYLRHVLDLPERSGSSQWLHGVSATERGDLAHKIMELVGRDGEDDFERNVGLATFPDAVGQRMAEGELETLVAGIQSFLRGDLYAEWIASAARLRTEVPFSAGLAGAVIEGKIDALVEAPDGALRVVDYKTGQPPAEANPDYDFQIGMYCAAVAAATGRLPEQAAIVYLDADDRTIHDGIEQIAREALARAREAVEGIERGEFGRGDCPGRDRCALAYACELT